MYVYAIRCDSSKQIGTGHIVRMMGLAMKLKGDGNTVIFVCKCIDDSNKARLLTTGFEVLIIEKDTDWIRNDQFRSQFPNKKNAAIIIDSYNIDESIEKNYRNIFERVIVFDDLINRKHDCDILIDPNFHSAEYIKQATRRAGEKAKMYIGAEYTILRPEFGEARKNIRPVHDAELTVEAPLIFFGGTDPTGETLRFLRTYHQLYVSSQDEKKFPVLRVLIGGAVSQKEEILEICKEIGAKVFVNPPNVAEIMLDADFFIGSGGTVTYERMALGLSGIVYSVADNQVEISRALDQAGAHRYAGAAQNSDYLNVVEELLNGIKVSRKQIEKCLSLVDGLGVSRVIEILRNSSSVGSL
jgi:UDP-2,4-diacetamido-2,4,6-trideoxy-beta-L-altropyranose hydrolase